MRPKRCAAHVSAPAIRPDPPCVTQRARMPHSMLARRFALRIPGGLVRCAGSPPSTERAGIGKAHLRSQIPNATPNPSSPALHARSCRITSGVRVSSASLWSRRRPGASLVRVFNGHVQTPEGHGSPRDNSTTRAQAVTRLLPSFPASGNPRTAATPSPASANVSSEGRGPVTDCHRLVPNPTIKSFLIYNSRKGPRLAKRSA